ncbi:MAG: hypothetical protein PHD03_03795 [Bacilli bacterium]|nr:hypothetical protein [Bacilli bacterium]MDD4407330.1 hypothetical protein [Bacilli bacterium]
MILKSFYRKKTTKIYLLIFILIFSVLGAVIIGKDYYIKKANLNYTNSFLYISSAKDIDVNNIQNVENFNKALFNDRFYYVAYNNILDEDKIIFPSIFKESYKINDQIEYMGKKNNYTFTIIDYYNVKNISPILYINSHTLEKLNKENNSYGYILKLKKWSQKDDTIKYIIKTYNIEPITSEIKTTNIDFTQHINSFTIYAYIIIIIFIIACIFTIYNILNDEKEKSYIYRSLGYSKKKTFKLQLVNIISLFVITSICSIILITIIKLIFKL